MGKRWLVGACVVIVGGCSGETDGRGDVTGKWCGREVASPEQCVGDEVEYLDLVQSDANVSGRICEAYEKDCAPIENGTVADGKLTFEFSPNVVGGRADLQLSGDKLFGELYSGKCGCSLPFTFHRF